MRRLPLALILTAAAVSTSSADPPVRARMQWKVVPQFTDEFTAAGIDGKKWSRLCGNWAGRQPGMFVQGNAEQKNGAAHLHLKAEQPPRRTDGYQDYTCGVLRSLNRIRYGFFEIRARAGNSLGSSGFWLHNDTPALWTEIDVFEISAGHPELGRKIHMDAPVLRYPGVKGELHFREVWTAPWNPADDWHTYGMEWDAAALRWYVDGTMVRQLPNTHWKQPLHVVLDTETMPGWFGLPDKASLPATFSVDWIRTWQKAADEAYAGTPVAAPAAPPPETRPATPAAPPQGAVRPAVPAGSTARPAIATKPGPVPAPAAPAR